MTKIESGSKRNLYIEGLRGAATLIIVIYHLVDRYQQIYLNNSIPWMDMWEKTDKIMADLCDLHKYHLHCFAHMGSSGTDSYI